MNENITITISRDLALSILGSLIEASEKFGGSACEDDVQEFEKATGLTRKDWEEWL